MKVYLRIFLIFVLASFKVAISLASDLGQSNDCMKKYSVTATKDNSSLQYSEQGISESEENEEDSSEPFSPAESISFSYFYHLFDEIFIKEQNRKINNIFFQDYSTDQQLFLLYRNFRI